MKYLLILCIIFTGHLLAAQPGSFTVSGKVKGLDSKIMYMVISDETAPRGFRRDSIVVVNGSFSSVFNIKETTYITISPGVDRVVKRVGANGYIPVKSSLLAFIASPGASINFSGDISGDFVNAYPSGDKANDDLTVLNKAIFPLLNQSANIEVKLSNKVVTDTAAIKMMKDSSNNFRDQVLAVKKNFLQEKPTSIAAAWLLSDMMLRSELTQEEAILFFDKMSPSLAEVPFYKEVEARVVGIKNTQVGRLVPEIRSTNTPDGQLFTLSSLRGKYVVIDFWGTWCGPCMAGMPKMKEYLAKYKDKMEILGVAQESDNGERWKATIERSALNWYHVLSRKNEDYVLKFSVAGFPTKIIVDPEGKIIARYVGETDEIYTRLDELLK